MSDKRKPESLLADLTNVASGSMPQVSDRRKPATRVKAGTLLGVLKDLEKIVPAKDTIPALSCVLIDARDGVITAQATNLDMWGERDCASDDRDGPASREWIASVRPFTALLPGKLLRKLLAEFDSEAMVTIDATDCNGGPGQATISAGRARFKLNALDPEHMPRVPAVEPTYCYDIRCSQLADALAAVRHAMSSEDTRYYLNGVFVHPLNLALRFAATDGKRLARRSIDGPDGAASFPPGIVSRKTVELLDQLLTAAAKADENAQVSVECASEDRGALIRWEMPAADGGTVTITAKTVDGDFPDYARVIPASPPIRAVVARAALAEAIKRVAVLASDKNNAVKAEFEAGLLRLTVTTPETGEAVEELPCTTSGGTVSVGLDHQYWREALGVMACDDVAMLMTDEGGPVRLQNAAPDADAEALVQVIMPVRV